MDTVATVEQKETAALWNASFGLSLNKQLDEDGIGMYH